MFFKSTAAILAVASVSAFTLTADPASAATRTFTVSKGAIESAVNGVLSRTKIHVDNLGARNGGSFLQQRSHVRLKVKGHMDATYRFSVPEYSVTINKKGGRYWRFYVSDFNSDRARAAIEDKRGGLIRFRVDFESRGSEIQGKCVTRRGVGKKRRWEECRIDVDRTAHINNAVVNASAKLVVRDGKLTFASPKASFRSSVKINNKLCKVLKKGCKALARFVEHKIEENVEANMARTMNKARGTVERAIRKVDSNLRRSGVKVTKLEDLGDRYRITIKYPSRAPKRAGSITG